MRKIFYLFICIFLVNKNVYAENLNIYLQCAGSNFDFIHILNDIAAVDDYPYNASVVLTDNHITIGNTIVINRYTLNFTTKGTSTKGSCILLKKKKI